MAAGFNRRLASPPRLSTALTYATRGLRAYGVLRAGPLATPALGCGAPSKEARALPLGVPLLRPTLDGASQPVNPNDQMSMAPSVYQTIPISHLMVPLSHRYWAATRTGVDTRTKRRSWCRTTPCVRRDVCALETRLRRARYCKNRLGVLTNRVTRQ